jgi:hypothetical protein
MSSVEKKVVPTEEVKATEFVVEEPKVEETKVEPLVEESKVEEPKVELKEVIKPVEKVEEVKEVKPEVRATLHLHGKKLKVTPDELGKYLELTRQLTLVQGDRLHSDVSLTPAYKNAKDALEEFVATLPEA